MTTSNNPWNAPAAVLLVGLMLVVVPLAGCVGGADSSDDGDGPEQGTPDDDGQDPDTLPPGGGEGGDPGGQVAHEHNRWYDTDDQLPPGTELEEITLVDDTYTINSIQQDPNDPLSRCPTGMQFCWGSVIVTPQATTEARTKIVPPGTERIEVTLEYSQGSYRDLKAWFQDPVTRGAVWNPLADSFPPGHTATVHNIGFNDSGPDPDNGHAYASQWRWLIEVRGNPAPVVPLPSMTGPQGLDVDVEIVAYRQDGPLPKEPPHPGFYAYDAVDPTDVYEIARVSGETQGQYTQAGPVYVEENNDCPTRISGECVPIGFSPGLAWKTKPGYDGFRSGSDETWDGKAIEGEPYAAALVPPGTSNLVAFIDIDGSPGDVGEVQFCLNKRTSPVQPNFGLEIGCETYTGQDRITFEHPVTELDSYYANNWHGNSSRWQFYVQIQSPDSGTSVEPFRFHEAGLFDGSFEARIVATANATLEGPPSWLGI